MSAGSSGPWSPVADQLLALLQPLGFKRNKLTFTNRPNQDVVQTLRLVKYRWNAPGQNRFELMISLYVATGEAGEFSWPGPPGRPQRFSIVTEVNVGRLWGDDAYLYSASAEPPDPELSRLLLTHFDQYIAPFLNACRTLDGILRTLSSLREPAGLNPYALSVAVVLARLGRLDESREYFRQVPGDRILVRQMAATHGVHLE